MASKHSIWGPGTERDKTFTTRGVAILFTNSFAPNSMSAFHVEDKPGTKIPHR
jgi:hypothetical protein